MPSIYLNHVKVAEESGGVVSLPNTVQFNNLKIGGTEVINSNRQIQNITGIDFSPSSGTGTPSSNLLDDYEEGTWNPAFSISVSGSITMSLQEGVYAKIGKTVFISCRVSTSSISSPLGILQITGLPFTSGNQTRFACTIADMRAWATAFTTPVTASIEGSSTAVLLTQQATNNSFGGVFGSDMSVSSGGNYMQVAGFYTI